MANESPRRRKGGAWKILAVAAGALALGGIGVVSYRHATDTARFHEVTDVFLRELRSDDPDAAYKRLSPRRRDRMSLVDFRTFAEHPAFRKSTGHELVRSRAWDGALRPNRACVRGRLQVDGKTWAVQVEVTRGEGDDWYVSSFGLQEPADVHLEDLLPECGLNDARLAGYSGPPVVNRTPPLD